MGWAKNSQTAAHHISQYLPIQSGEKTVQKPSFDGCWNFPFGNIKVSTNRKMTQSLPSVQVEDK